MISNNKILLLLNILLYLKNIISLPLPFNEYSFILARNKLEALDNLDYTVLNEKERIDFKEIIIKKH